MLCVNIIRFDFFLCLFIRNRVFVGKILFGSLLSENLSFNNVFHIFKRKTVLYHNLFVIISAAKLLNNRRSLIFCILKVFLCECFAIRNCLCFKNESLFCGICCKILYIFCGGNSFNHNGIPIIIA